MAAPFVFIGTYTIKEGQLEAFTQDLRGFFEHIEANEPRLLAIHAYTDEAGTEATFVQVHPDAASMEFHMQVAREHIERAYGQFLDASTSVQVYGTPSDAVLEMTRQLAGSGVPLSVKAHHLGGFTRLRAAAAI